MDLDGVTNSHYGPNLNGLFGRQSGTTSDSLSYFGNIGLHVLESGFSLVQVYAFYIPGTKMVFPKLKKPQDRADLISYLKQSTAS
ncbi:hypothetical protein ACJW30_10G175500 [Castanea mollissima]